MQLFIAKYAPSRSPYNAPTQLQIPIKEQTTTERKNFAWFIIYTKYLRGESETIRTNASKNMKIKSNMQFFKELGIFSLDVCHMSESAISRTLKWKSRKFLTNPEKFYMWLFFRCQISRACISSIYSI